MLGRVWLVVGRAAPLSAPDYALKQRIQAGEVVLKHCPDPEMPADFMTKWLAMPEVNKSIRYVTNARNAVQPSNASNHKTAKSAIEPGATIGGSVSGASGVKGALPGS